MNDKSRYEFLKIPWEGDFVYVKKHKFEEELGGTKYTFLNLILCLMIIRKK